MFGECGELDKLKKELRESKENAQRLIEELSVQANLLANVHDAVTAIDQDGRFIYWNGMAEKLFGWSAQEVIGRTREETVYFPNSLNNRNVVQEQREGSFEGEVEYRRKDGTVIWTDTHYTYVTGGEGAFKGVVACHRDITQRKKMQEEERRLKGNLAAGVEALSVLHSLNTGLATPPQLQDVYAEIMGAAIKLTRADRGHIVAVDQDLNREVKAYHGFSAWSMENFRRKGGEAGIHALQTLKRVIVEDILVSPYFIDSPNMQILIDEGVRTLQTTPMISSTGHLVGILSTHYAQLHRFSDRELQMLDMLARWAADIIQRSLEEEKLYQSERRALALVDELKRMDENKNEFLGILSHELRNPLSSVTMSLSLLDMVPYGSEEYQKAKDVMKRQTAILTRLLDELLDITRMTRKTLTLKKENTNLNRLIENLVEDFQEFYKQRGIRLVLKRAAEPIYLEADGARLSQSVGNLLHNAAKFSEKGDQVTVTVQRDPVTRQGIIEVRDEGLGIEPHILPDLFLPFVQVEQKIDRQPGGLGLGLAVANAIAELHGGTLEAMSEGLGKGARFILRLPLPGDGDKCPDHRPSGTGNPEKTLRILVIDDIPDVAEILCSLLRLSGHEVVSAFNGYEGIAKAKDFGPDVILCDLGLPDISGYDVARTIRGTHKLKDIYLVAVSGYAHPDDTERAKEAGFDTHFAKPLDLSVLEKTLGDLAKEK